MVLHQGGLSSGWSVISVVLSGWPFIRIFFHQGGLTTGGSVLRVVCYKGGLSSGAVSHQGGLLSGVVSSRCFFTGWSFIRGSSVY